MNDHTYQPSSGAKGPHLRSLERFLRERPQITGFKLYDWIRTLDTEQLGRIHYQVRGIWACLGTETPPAEQAQDVVDVAILAYGAELRGVSPQRAIKELPIALASITSASLVELFARKGWVMVTERISIRPRGELPYKVTKEGCVQSDFVEDSLARSLLKSQTRR